MSNIIKEGDIVFINGSTLQSIKMATGPFFGRFKINGISNGYASLTSEKPIKVGTTDVPTNRHASIPVGSLFISEKQI